MFAYVFTAMLAALLLAVDPTTFLPPTVSLSPAEQGALARGETISKILPGPGDQVGLFAISRIDADGDALIANARAIEDLRRSSFVSAIARFSNPPQLSDLDGLVLSPRDVDAALACRVGACSFKLTAAEIALLQQHDAEAAAAPRDRVQRAFRRVVLARVVAYLDGGLSALPSIVNRKTPICLDRIFNDIVAASAPLPGGRCTTDWLRGAGDPAIESFLYWSQETYGAGKPVVAVTHVGLFPVRAAGDTALVIGKQVFASRYMTGGLAVTAVTVDPGSGKRYLVYVNRTGVDLLGGFFGSLKRSILESRLKREVPAIVGKLRHRLESKTR